MSAKEAHTNFQDWAVTLAPILLIIAAWTLQKTNINFLSLLKHNPVHITWICSIALILRVFWHSFEKFDELEEKQKPRLVATKCWATPITPEHPPLMYHLQVENISTQEIVDCKGFIMEIKSPYRSWKGKEQLAFEKEDAADLA